MPTFPFQICFSCSGCPWTFLSPQANSQCFTLWVNTTSAIPWHQRIQEKSHPGSADSAADLYLISKWLLKSSYSLKLLIFCLEILRNILTFVAVFYLFWTLSSVISVILSWMLLFLEFLNIFGLLMILFLLFQNVTYLLFRGLVVQRKVPHAK